MPSSPAPPPPARRPAKSERASLQGLCTIADQGLVSLTSFLTTVLVGRVSKEELGIYALGLGTFWLALGIPKAVVWTPYTSRAARLRRGPRRRLVASNTLLLLAIAGAGAGLVAISGVVSLVVFPERAWLAPFFFSLAPLWFVLTLREHVRRIAIADFKTPQLLLVDLPLCLSTALAIALLSMAGWLTSTTAFLATATTAAFTLPLVLKPLLATRTSTGAFAAQTRRNWEFGRWLMVVAVALLLSDGSLRWMLTGMHGMEAMGVFGAAFSVVMLVNPLMLAMNTFARSWATRIYHRSGQAGLMRHTLRATAVAVGIAAVAMVALTIIGNFALDNLFGEGFSDPRLVTLLAAGICLQATLLPAEATLTAMEQGKQLSNAAIVRLITTIVVGAPLVYLQGPTGIGWAMLARSIPVAILYGATLLRTSRGVPGATAEPFTNVSPATNAAVANQRVAKPV